SFARLSCPFFVFTDPATTETYPLSLHDALPILAEADGRAAAAGVGVDALMDAAGKAVAGVVRERFPSAREALVLCGPGNNGGDRSEEHTSELQSRENLVCRLLLEKKKKRRYLNK